jgi:hypothetical protein
MASDWDNVYRPAVEDGGVVRPGSEGVGVWREGDSVVVDKLRHEMPDRCVRCNEPANGLRVKKTFYWHPSWIYLLIVISILVYAILALVLRKSIVTQVPLCERHKKRRTIGFLVGVCGSLGALFVLLAAAAYTNYFETLIVPCLIALVAAPITSAILATTLRPAYIDDRVARFKAGRAFVASL